MEMSGCYTDFFLPSKFCIIMNTDLVHSFQFMLLDRKSTRLNSSHSQISYAVFCLKKKKKEPESAVFHDTYDHLRESTQKPTETLLECLLSMVSSPVIVIVPTLRCTRA